MSRIGNFRSNCRQRRIQLSSGEISVKGPLGTLTQSLSAQITVERVENQLQIKVADSSNAANAMSGTVRALLANMVQGVTKGYEKKLMLVGVGYRAQAQGDKLNLTLGFSHPVVHQMPKRHQGRDADQTEIMIKGIDKQVVGQVAAEVPPIAAPSRIKAKACATPTKRSC